MKHRFTALSAAALVALGACAEPVTSPAAAPAVDAPSFDVDASTTDTYLVRFKGNGIPGDFASTVAGLGGEVIFAHDGVGIAAVAGLDAAGASVIASSGNVAAVDMDAYTEIEPAFVGEPEAVSPESPTNPALASFYPRQWNMRAISAPAAWTAGKLGASTTLVGILDTGIDYISPDLSGRVNLALSRSFLSSAENARVQAAFPGAHPIADLNYHGTHVASTVASNGIVAAGVTSRVTLVGLKVCTPGTAGNGWRGSCPTSGTLAAILYAADNGLHVINMSLGGSFQRRAASAQGGFGPSFLATINQVMNYATRNGTTVVVSAGNSAFDMDHDGNGYKSYCSAAAVICVSATGPTGGSTNGPWTNIDALAGYSNYGRSAVDVAAPGGNWFGVIATCSRFSLAIPVCRTGNYALTISGTSMAAPHVTGVAALIAGDVGHSPSQIQARLQQSADDLGQPGTDPAYGKGRINAARAMGL